MNEKSFQLIFDKLQDYLVDGWESLAFYAIYFKGSYSMKYYTKVNGKYVDCFELGKWSDMDLMKLFMSIDRVIAPERNALNGDKKWNSMTFIVNSEGDMKTQFDYSSIDDEITYVSEWKQRYLKDYSN
ncbi:MAG: hypothetical protein K6G26_02170 [Lachnospiraceae bacterium]|nr:hypothetical protein [Lachnospiraceae bacterium]